MGALARNTLMGQLAALFLTKEMHFQSHSKNKVQIMNLPQISRGIRLTFRLSYSRMDQVKFVDDSLYKI